MPRPRRRAAPRLGVLAELGHSAASALCCSRRSTSPASCDVGLRARAAEVVEQHRLAVGRRLGDPHVARDHGLVDPVAEEAAHVGRDLLGEVVAAVEHGQHDALELEQRIELRRTRSMVRSRWLRPSSAKNSHCSGTSTRVGRDQGVEGQQAERRRAVDQHVVVVACRGSSSASLQAVFAALHRRPARARPPTGRPPPGTSSRPGTAVRSIASPSCAWPSRTS